MVTISPSDTTSFVPDCVLSLKEQSPTGPLQKGAWERLLHLDLFKKIQEKKKGEFLRYFPWKKWTEAPLKRSLSPSSLQEVEEDLLQEALESKPPLVFLNGHFQKSLSSLDQLPEGVMALSMEEAQGAYGTFLENRWRQMLTQEKGPFALINHAFSEGGLVLFISPGVHLEKPLRCLHLIAPTENEEKTTHYYDPKIQVYTGKGASWRWESAMAFVGSGKASFFINEYIEGILEESSSLHHAALFSLKGQQEKGWHTSTVRALLKKGSRYHYTAVHDGSCHHVQDFEATLEGEEAHVDFQELSLLSDRRESHTAATVNHLAPHTTSYQHVKSLVAAGGKGSFAGKIFIGQKAQKTDAYQLHNTLLLEGKDQKRGQSFSQPNLEIFADDVKASHGTTMGQLEEKNLFYMQSRGIPKKEAKKHFLRGFCQEILDKSGRGEKAQDAGINRWIVEMTHE